MSGRSYPVDANEQSRLAELVRYRVLDSAPEAVFNDTVKLAQSLFGVSASLVSLIDDKRQWFKARVGIDACETGRDAAFCAYAILGDDVMVVPDARADPRFVHNPLVTSPPFIRFYAGAPLTTPAGYNIGTLCIFDPEPRPEGMSPLDRRHFAMLARIVIERLEARRVQLGRDEEAQALYDAADRLSATAAKLDGQADTLAAFSGDGARKSGAAAQGVRRLVSIGQRVDEDVTQIAEDIAAATENACVLRKTIGDMRLNLNDIVSVAGRITKIARQTNMLAINASIEAARAGDAGRGFAVIAREVGTLAASTADATDHIQATLQAIETTVAQSVGQCDGLADRIGEMNNRSGQIRTAAAMAAEIRIDIGTGIEQIATVAKHVGEQADTVKGSTAALLGEATTLRVHASGLAADRTETGRNRAVA